MERDQAKQERLAAALRNNLRRRKAPGRVLTEDGADAPDRPDTPGR